MLPRLADVLTSPGCAYSASVLWALARHADSAIKVELRGGGLFSARFGHVHRLR